MLSGGSTRHAADMAAAEVLATARSHRRSADAEEAALLTQVVAWAQLHPVSDPDGAATWLVRNRLGDEDTQVPITSHGVPLVDAECVSDLGTALGLSDTSARHLIAQATELFHRLPRTWARIQGGALPAWKARRVAEHTQALSAEAAGWVDVQVAPFAHRLGLAQLERTVEEAIARFMPEFADKRREAAADGRSFTVDHRQVSFAGTSQVHGELDLADALDLDAAVTAGAEALKDLGCTDSLDVRRAKAVGELARRDLCLDLAAPPPDSERPRSTSPRPKREVVLYVHLSDAALSGKAGIGRVENCGPHLVTAETIREWLGVDGTRINVRPVIDLSVEQAAPGYAIPEWIREVVILRDQTCVFPYCTRPARSCDLDHVVPYDQANPARGGPTSTANLAALCRRHHRLKTKGLWRYEVIVPGTYAWMSPRGYTFLTDASGTTDTSPAPAPGPTGEPDEPGSPRR